MSERSTSTETLSINFSGSVSTDQDVLVTKFLNDITELMEEWQKLVQITNLNVAVHDHRTFEDYKKLSEEEDTQ